jgi:hypothetical protein
MREDWQTDDVIDRKIGCAGWILTICILVIYISLRIMAFDHDERIKALEAEIKNDH